MAIPVQILYSLQISTGQKFSVGIVFTVGIITMVVAIVRVVSLDSATKDGNVSTTWLILFALIEATVGRSPLTISTKEYADFIPLKNSLDRRMSTLICRIYSRLRHCFSYTVFQGLVRWAQSTQLAYLVFSREISG